MVLLCFTRSRLGSVFYISSALACTACLYRPSLNLSFYSSQAFDLFDHEQTGSISFANMKVSQLPGTCRVCCILETGLDVLNPPPLGHAGSALFAFLPTGNIQRGDS